jgi:hypothetical protein
LLLEVLALDRPLVSDLHLSGRGEHAGDAVPGAQRLAFRGGRAAVGVRGHPADVGAGGDIGLAHEGGRLLFDGGVRPALLQGGAEDFDLDRLRVHLGLLVLVLPVEGQQPGGFALAVADDGLELQARIDRDRGVDRLLRKQSESDEGEHDSFSLWSGFDLIILRLPVKC